MYRYYVRTEEIGSISGRLFVLNDKQLLERLDQPSDFLGGRPSILVGKMEHYYAYQLSMQRGKFRAQVLPLKLRCCHG